MKNLTFLLALSLIPMSLLAQSKPAVHKAAPVKRTAANRSTVSPARRPAAAPLAVAQPVAAAPVQSETPRQEQASATTYVAPKPQPAQVSRSSAQPVAPARTNTGGIKIGFRIGGNSSTIGGTDPEAFGEGVKAARSLGFHAGAILSFGGPNFSVQPEILYSQYGIKMTAGSDYVQLKHNMLEVPILFKASFGQPSLRFFVNAGPAMTYTLSSSFTVHEAGQTESAKLDLTNSGRLSFGATGGAGVAIQAGPGAVQLEARYSYLFSTNEFGTKLTPQNAMLSVGYLLPLGGR